MADKDFVLEFDYRNKRYRDAERGLRAFAKDLETGFEKATPVLKKELQAYLVNVTTALAQRHGNPYPSGTTAKTLSRRSGKAMARIKSSVKVKGKKIDDVEGGFSGPFYLAPQEYGATIRARKSKYLTIPLPAALNANGTPKKKSAREWQNTFIQRSKKGNLIIFQNRGKNIVPLYVLKKQVKIPPRLGARATLEAGLPYFVDRVIDRMVASIRGGV